MLLSYIVWDPKPGMFDFRLPILDRPILWYGFFFALGFFLGYFVGTYLLRRYFLHFHQFRKEELKKTVANMADKIIFYVIIGAVIGAKLGDVLFYQDWRDIVRHPLSIIAVWEGGLSSHGGTVGVLIALWVFSKRNKIPYLTCVDFTVIPTALAAVCIRTGNFFNQEILGTPTSLPWGVLFLHPADGGQIVPRHPAQLYEAVSYLIIFFILLWYWHRRPPFEPRGKITGLFLILVFSARFLIEFVKVEQSVYLTGDSFLTMGQCLSLPFILLGIYLFTRGKRRPASYRKE